MREEVPVDSLEGEQRTYVNTDGKETTITVLSEKRISEGGAYGEIYLVEGLVGDSRRTFALKRFKDSDEWESYLDAEKAFSVYEEAKQAGLSVFPTYDISKDRPEILMTFPEMDEHTTIVDSAAGRTVALEEQGFDKLQSVSNLSELIDGAFDEARKAAAHGISFHSNVFFFVVNTETGEVSFILGDLDEIHTYKTIPDKYAVDTEFDQYSYETSNLMKVEGMLRLFLRKNTIDSAESIRELSSRYDGEMQSTERRRIRETGSNVS